MQKMRVGVVGCGNICDQYLKAMPHFESLEVAACADLDAERARGAAERYGIRAAESVETLVEDPQIDLLVNLTPPAAHFDVTTAALANGKHVWSEKPLATTRADAARIAELAESRGLRVGCAPDTFLGSALQTARKLIDEGAIGRPVAATGFMLVFGHERWHPDPFFFYRPGGGPMLDMGPYYLTALLQLLGPFKRVTGSTSIAIPRRTVGAGKHKGETIEVQTPDHVTGTIEFQSGAVATVMMTFAAAYKDLPNLTVYGSEGVLRCADPNVFDAPVFIRGPRDDDWSPVPVQHTTGYGRGVGAADLAAAARSGRDHRASLEQAASVLDAMLGFFDAADTGRAYDIRFTCERPAPMPEDLPLGRLD